MRIFLDTANIAEIREAVSWGVVDGVTTNPTLVAKEGVDFKTRVLEICDIVEGPVSAECVETEAPKMIEEARMLASWHPSIYVKIPMTLEGMKALKVVSAEGINTNITLVFSVNQALIAAKNGAGFISVFVGRVDDVGASGMAVVEECVNMVQAYGFESEVLAASIRHPLHVAQCLAAGADIATIPFKVVQQMFNHPLTDQGVEKFLADWRKVSQK